MLSARYRADNPPKCLTSVPNVTDIFRTLPKLFRPQKTFHRKIKKPLRKRDVKSLKRCGEAGAVCFIFSCMNRHSVSTYIYINASTENVAKLARGRGGVVTLPTVRGGKRRGWTDGGSFWDRAGRAGGGGSRRAGRTDAGGGGRLAGSPGCPWPWKSQALAAVISWPAPAESRTFGQ